MNKNLLSPEGQKDFRNKIGKAFQLLRKKGYFARQNFWCCQSCAWSDVPDGSEKVVFYHNQDNDNIPDGYVYLAWEGSAGDICKALDDAGLSFEWSGDESKRIKAVYQVQ